jgi:hypothetical protein
MAAYSNSQVRNVQTPSVLSVTGMCHWVDLDTRARISCETRRLGQGEPVKYWEIIADRLHAEGWSYGIAEHFTQHGFLFCVDAHREGKRFIVKADDLLTAFLSLERDAIAAQGANGNATHQNAV